MTPTGRQDENATGELGRQIVENMERITWDRIGEEAIRNAETNFQYLEHGKSLAELRKLPLGEGDSALVIAAGPSVKRMDPLGVLKAYNYRGAVVIAESALYYCLRNGVIPDLAVTVDPHVDRIVRWFGDPNLTEEALISDDYYRRQEQDDAFYDELRANERLVKMIDEFGPKIKIALSTSSSRKVVERVLECRMDVYWWNPMLDNPDEPNSVTKELMRRNGLPCVNAGGNVGTSAWMMAGAAMGKKHVAVTGIDFSYYSGTPYVNTQYYTDAVNLLGEDNLDQFFIRIKNDDLGEWFFTDPAYMWYREVFLEMAADADYKTYNCTGGGILFGDPIETMTLEAFLEKFSEPS